MNIVVTVDENWAIGKNDKELLQIPLDRKHLQNLTAGSVLIMGRKALQLLPQGQPLYGRENIVLSKDPAFKVKGATVFSDLDELLAYVDGLTDKEIFVAGGESVYKQLLPYCDTVYATFVEKEYDANRYFHNLDQSPEWKMVEESDEQTYFDLTYYFRKYERI